VVLLLLPLLATEAATQRKRNKSGAVIQGGPGEERDLSYLSFGSQYIVSVAL